MRNFEVKNDLAELSVKSIAQNEFELTEVEKEENTLYLYPENELCNEIYVEAEQDNLAVEFDMVSVEKENLNEDAVVPLIKAKNRFLEAITGTTVADRRQKLRREVRPEELMTVKQVSY